MSTAMALVILGGVTTTYVFLLALLRSTQNDKEPPVVLDSIPFVSPILGMVRWSMDFYSVMKKRFHDLPMYTLRMPGARIYVVNALDLIPVVHKQWRTLIFAPIQVKAAKAVMGVSQGAVAILERDMVTEAGFVNGMIKATHPTMINGPALEALNIRAFEVLDVALRGLNAPTTVSMYSWIDEQIMHATTEAIYGPSNPMRNASNLEHWHKYHPAIMFLMLDLLPQNIFFRSAIKSRESLVRSFAKYYKEGNYKQGSEYIQQFTKHCIDQHLPEADIPRVLLGTVFNNVANSVPSAFWVIYRVFSNPVVLEECRGEVLQAVRHDPNGTSSVDMSYILNSCPILLSTYQEVFRYHSMANSVRFVSEDHMLDNRYLLKKGGLVMISARVQHKNPSVWGESVDKFDHRRFMKQQSGGKRSFAVAFRGFGGGTTLCPGRHFASSEILLLTTMLLLRFHVRPADGKPWVLPTTAKSSQAEAMEQPDADINIELVPRPDVVGRTWRIVSSGQRGVDLMTQA